MIRRVCVVYAVPLSIAFKVCVCASGAEQLLGFSVWADKVPGARAVHQTTRTRYKTWAIATHVIYSIFLAVMVASAGVAAYLIALSIVQDENGAGGDKSVGAPVGNTERTSSLDATVTIWTSIWLGILFILLTVLGVKTLLAVTIKQVAMSRRKRSEVWLYGLSRFLSLSLSLSLRT